MTKTKWPKNDPQELAAFFGRIELNAEGKPTEVWQNTFLTQINTPFPMRSAAMPDCIVKKITCHREVAASLQRVLGAIWSHYGQDLETVQMAEMDLLGNCYVWRNIGGSHRLSMHAYGAAIELGPIRTRHNGEAVAPVDMIFESEGWTWTNNNEGWVAVEE